MFEDNMEESWDLVSFDETGFTMRFNDGPKKDQEVKIIYGAWPPGEEYEVIFTDLRLEIDGFIVAHAQGHPNEVIEAFHSVAHLLLSSRGPWRIVNVSGKISDEVVTDSSMEWTLIAKLKGTKIGDN